MGPHWIASKKNLAFRVSPGFECVNVREISSDGRHLGSIAGKAGHSLCARLSKPEWGMSGDRTWRSKISKHVSRILQKFILSAQSNCSVKILQWQRCQSGASHSHISQPVNFKSVFFWIQRSFSISPCLRLGKMCHRRPTSRAPGIPAHVPKLHPQVTEPQKIQFVICTDIKFCMRFPHTYSMDIFIGCHIA